MRIKKLFLLQYHSLFTSNGSAALPIRYLKLVFSLRTATAAAFYPFSALIFPGITYDPVGASKVGNVKGWECFPGCVLPP